MAYTHGYHASVLRSHDVRTIANSAQYLAAELVPGRTLLDLGSGAGTITAEFAGRLAPGRVSAVEIAPEAIALTRREIARRGLGNVDFHVADGAALPFADASFDIVHAHQVLQHVRDPVAVLGEMRRVCRPGGVVAARDSDYAGFIWYPELPGLALWMRWYQRAARANGGEPDAGRRLLSWARRAGLGDIAATSSTWCLADAASRGWWGGMWADRILNSRIAAQLRSDGVSEAELRGVSQAWRDWAAAEDGWISIVHGEILCRV